MPDFTSSLYLGLAHASSDLPDWSGLTLGKPAALADPPGAERVECELAALTECESALLAPSTLHLFVDLFALLARPGMGIFLDRGTYPIARWGARQARLASVPVRTFRSCDADDLERKLQARPAVKPIVAADGFSPADGQATPIANYARLAAERGGLVVIDDTQALGVLGSSPGGTAPYGLGGGGSLPHAMLTAPNVVVVSSLAKAFGAPLAMLGGSAALVERFRRRSLTRMHCSPPSIAAIAAAARAIEINRHRGDAIRRRLAARVAQFERGIRQLGLRSHGGLFPVRPLRLPPGGKAETLHPELARRGVRAVLAADRGGRANLTFILTAAHSAEEIDEALDHLANALTVRRPRASAVNPLVKLSLPAVR